MADYFDYEVKHQSNVYLLTKRYSNAEDIPDVTSEECRKGLKDLCKILASFNPHVPPGTFAGEPMANIARLLNADQLNALATTGLPVATLTGQQHAEAWKLALKFYVQSQADHIEEASTYLEERKPADPVFQWQTISNIHAFGYDTRCVRLNKIIFIPVSDANQIVVTPNGMTGHLTGYTTHKSPDGSHETRVPDPDPTDPSFLAETTRKWLDESEKTSAAISIAQEIKALNRESQQAEQYKVDPIYAPKKVTLVGVEKLSPEIRMRSLAAVYGLRVVKQETGASILMGPLQIEPKQLSDVGRSLASVLPAPIYHAIRTKVLAARKKVKGVNPPLTTSEYEKQSYAIHRAAIRMFRYTAEPIVKSQEGQKLALSGLGERASSLFAIAFTVDAFSEACWLADCTPPPFVTDFDHIILTGGITHNEEGAERFALHLSYIDPKTGIKYKGVGFSNAIIP